MMAEVEFEKEVKKGVVDFNKKSKDFKVEEVNMANRVKFKLPKSKSKKPKREPKGTSSSGVGIGPAPYRPPIEN